MTGICLCLLSRTLWNVGVAQTIRNVIENLGIVISRVVPHVWLQCAQSVKATFGNGVRKFHQQHVRIVWWFVMHLQSCMGTMQQSWKWYVQVCMTSMILLTLEKTHWGHRSLDEQTHANRCIMAARGNATSFPWPWHDWLQQLQAGEHPQHANYIISLEHTGEDQANGVSVLLKTADAHESDKDSARLTHQAMFRRGVVVKLVASMKRRGHRAYRHVHMEGVQRRATQLPTNGVPPESIR